MIKSIIFDFDGTLVDTAPGLILTANKIFKKYNKDIGICENNFIFGNQP